ncbi:MAG: hypothetical protein LBG19_06185 [Prevotellaceae bacterium]|jgi:hypothetical protein|nr:hypothetical protein [Prevotellaceae bacterium]
MKKLLSISLLIAVSGGLMAQKVKGKTETLNIFDKKGKELRLPPIIRRLESNEKYVFLYPDFVKSSVSLVESFGIPSKECRYNNFQKGKRSAWSEWI